MTIVHVLNIWYHLCLGHGFLNWDTLWEFVIFDHSIHLELEGSLFWFSWQCRWVKFLQHFFFDIQYVKGKENVIVNALSKKEMGKCNVSGQEWINWWCEEEICKRSIIYYIVYYILHTSIYHDSWCLCKVNLVVSFFTT